MHNAAYGRGRRGGLGSTHEFRQDTWSAPGIPGSARTGTCGTAKLSWPSSASWMAQQQSVTLRSLHIKQSPCYTRLCSYIPTRTAYPLLLKHADMLSSRAAEIPLGRHNSLGHACPDFSFLPRGWEMPLRWVLELWQFSPVLFTCAGWYMRISATSGSRASTLCRAACHWTGDSLASIGFTLLMAAFGSHAHRRRSPLAATSMSGPSTNMC